MKGFRASTVVVLLLGLLCRALNAHQDPPSMLRQVGLYRTADSALIVVWSPAAGRRAVGLPGSLVRGLAGEGDTVSYGPSLGVTSPVQGTIRFSGAAGQPASAIVWRPVNGPEVTAKRVALREREVSFAGSASHLAGTVILPESGGPHPAIVFLHGSGPETRETSRVFAYLLAVRGIASLIYDKRANVNVPFEALARDALAGVDLLGRDPEVQADRIGLFGPSQGAWVALEASRLRPGIAFIVLQSGDATTPLEQEMHRGEVLVRATGRFSEDDTRAMIAFRRRKFLYAITGDDPAAYGAALAEARRASWFREVGDGLPNRDFWRPNGLFEPAPALRAYRGPLLAVFGEKDASKDVALNATRMREIFSQAGHRDATVLVFPNGNHGLFETATGQPLEREYPALTRLVPGYLDTLAAWVGRHGLGRPARRVR